MSDITFTMHAETRIQQRGIPPMVIDLLMQFGSASRCGGAERLMFDKLAPPEQGNWKSPGDARGQREARSAGNRR
jgi:hypothetical protein